MNLAVLIPAYQPDAILLEVVREILEAGFRRVIVVDDGSTRPHCAAVFACLRDTPRVEVRAHPHNRGKGAALNTGLEYFRATIPLDSRELGVITVDADGQHRLPDILRVARELEEHPDSLVLGSRTFREDCVPLGRRIGSVLQRLFVRLVLGRDIRDPQTGLRAIPTDWVVDLLAIPHTGYEWETQMLWECRRRPIRQVFMESIYIDDNKSSHFHPVKDTLRLYFAILRSRLLEMFSRSRES
ncbi:MAG: glycosyltransferase family 2 protein [Candidatus Eremiobacterota bacterium]